MKSRKVSERKRLAAALLIFAVLIALDQYSKYLAVLYLKEGENLVLLPGIFRLVYVENYGAAFGTMQNSTLFLMTVNGVLLLYLLLVYRKFLHLPGYRLLRLLCIVIASGGAGNIIDRFFRGFVVDFFYFELIDFPVFNVADCYITCGITALLVGMFTIYKEDDADLLLPFKKGNGHES